MRQREGYLLVDHQASLGRRKQTARLAMIRVDPRGKRYEAATLTCAHCKVTVVKNPMRQRERMSCMKCGGKYICDLCAFRAAQADYVHMPFERLIEDNLHG
jgi:hypothetical protein